MLILIEKFLNHCKNQNKSPNTTKAYSRDLVLFVDYFKLTNENVIDRLNVITLEELYGFLEIRSNRSPATVARIVSAIRSFYDFLHQFRYIKENVSVYLKQPKKPKRLPKFLTQDESKDLLNSVDKVNSRFPERDYAILMTFLSTGIRVSELVSINISDINDGMLRVVGKGNAERYIPLSNSCQDAINQYLSVKRHYCGDALFTTERKNRMQSNPVGLIVKKYLGAIGKEGLSTHKLRHTSASTWIENGADLLQVQELLGHKSVATTQVYTHINKDKLKDVVNNTIINKGNVLK